MLDVLDVHTYYRDSYVLQGVSLGLQEGQVVVVLGRGEHDHRHVTRRRVAAKLREHLVAIRAREHAVEDHEGGALFVHRAQGVGAGRCRRDAKARPREMIRNERGDVRLVVDDKDPLARRMHGGQLGRVQGTHALKLRRFGHAREAMRDSVAMDDAQGHDRASAQRAGAGAAYAVGLLHESAGRRVRDGVGCFGLGAARISALLRPREAP